MGKKKTVAKFFSKTVVGEPGYARFEFWRNPDEAGRALLKKTAQPEINNGKESNMGIKKEKVVRTTPGVEYVQVTYENKTSVSQCFYDAGGSLIEIPTGETKSFVIVRPQRREIPMSPVVEEKVITESGKVEDKAVKGGVDATRRKQTKKQGENRGRKSGH